MNCIYKNYLKGHYRQCLLELNNYCSSHSLENAYILENNKFVCKTLDSAAKNEPSVTLESFLSLYDNYCLTLKHSNRLLSIDKEVTILINVYWFALSTLDGSAKNKFVWDLLLHKVLDFCVEVSSNKSTVEHTTSDFITDLLSNLLSAFESNLKHGRIILELAICTILVIMMSQSNCDEKLYEFISLVLTKKTEIMAFLSIEEEPSSNDTIAFKLGYFKIWHDVVNDTQCLFAWMDILKFLKAPNGLILKITNHSCSSRQCCQSFKNYCLALKHYGQENYHQALGYLFNGLPMLGPEQLLYRYRCLLGQLYSVVGERYKAVESFTEAVKLVRNLPTGHYYLGREYGLMGLHENMLKSYQNLIMSYKKDQQKIWSDNPLIERILEVHNGSTIRKTEAIYVLAVAYGINEMFDEASVAFEKLLNQRNLCSILDNSDTHGIAIPQIVTIYHESAAINLLTGNLVKAEELCRMALTIYPDRNSAENDEHHKSDLHGTKDIAWIQNVLQNELQSNIEETPKSNRYYECFLSFFEEDVIGLLLLADLQRIQDSDECRITLNQALLLLSKYIARTQKDPIKSDRVLLVKALTAKTCLQIARMQTTTKPFEDVDKMFKRALSCNHGDKDVLYHYATFLVSAEKTSDGEKLWNTFYEKDSIIQHEEAQSLSLRYLLRTQISQRQIENLSLKFL